MEKEVKKFIEEAQKIRMTGEEKSSVRKSILNNIGAPASSPSATEPTSFFGGLNFMAFSAIILLLVVGASYSSIRSRNNESPLALNQETELLPMAAERFASDDVSMESAVQLEGGETEVTSVSSVDLKDEGEASVETLSAPGIVVEPEGQSKGNNANTSEEIFKMVDNEEELEKYLGVADESLDEVFPNGVDFKNDRVIFAFLGDRPTSGYSVEIKDVSVVKGRGVVVRLIEKGPASGCVNAQVITSPYSIAKIGIPIMNDQISFDLIQEDYSCVLGAPENQ